MPGTLSPAPERSKSAVKTDKRPKFDSNNDFQSELRRRVDDYFRTTGRRRRDCPQMYVKSAIVLSAFVALYAALVFFATSLWQAVPLSILLGLTIAGIGFNVQHDAGHQAYSNHRWVNRLMSLSMDLIGGSSYLWHWKHAILHHTYVNITDHDTDIDLGFLGRLSPHQKRYAFHRWQHFYLWPLYGFLAISWHLVGDFRDAILGRLVGQRIPRPKGWDLAVFLGGKLFFFAAAFAVPLMWHSLGAVLLCYGVVELTLGIVLSIVFQLAHAVEEAEFPLPNPETDRLDSAWAIHQVETTVDFARGSRVASWLLGGLNFQIEHHLFPRICHVNYPAISEIVKATCQDYGVRYSEHTSFGAGLRSHYRWLKKMGRADEAA